MRMQWTLQHGMGMRDNAAEAQVMYHQFRGKRPREITRKGAVYRRCSSCPASRRPTGHLMVVHGIHQSYRYFDSVLLLCGGHALPLPCSDLGMATIKPLWDKASAFTMQRAGAHAGRLSFVSNFDWCARRGWRPGSHLPAQQSPCLPQSTPEVSSSSRHGQQLLLLLLLLQPEQSSILSVCCKLTQRRPIEEGPCREIQQLI